MKIFLKAMYFLVGSMLGLQTANWLFRDGKKAIEIFKWSLSPFVSKITVSILFCILFGLIFVIVIPVGIQGFKKLAKDVVKRMRELSIAQLLLDVLGLILSLVLATLICTPIYKSALPEILKTIIVVVIYVALGYIGMLIMFSKAKDIEALFKFNQKEKERDKDREAKESREGREETRTKFLKKQMPIAKVLDTSVIIDGRIFDILKTGFIEGPIVIPTFVLDELRYIADSGDALKRNRGRRGLDILNKIQKELDIEVVITEKNYSDIHEVDTKLLKLAQDLKGKVVTNDFNLNKVAVFQGVGVLNINELANAVKSVVIPGEEMNVQLIREGKENNQAVAYLDDGTMIVVEEGRHLIGKYAQVMVTSVLQTSAGRMIFAKPI